MEVLFPEGDHLPTDPNPHRLPPESLRTARRQARILWASVLVGAAVVCLAGWRWEMGRSPLFYVGVCLALGAILHVHLERVYARAALHMEHVRTSARETREYLRGYFDQLPLGGMILDEAGQVLHINQRAVDLLGLPEPILRTTDWRQPDFWLLAADGNPLDPDRQPVPLALATLQPQREVILGIERPDGEWNWVAWSVEPRKDETGALKDLFVLLQDVTRQRTVEAELTVQSLRDRLTGLPNRSLFMERLSQALLRLGRRTGTAVGVVFLDLDRFKMVNDSLSHEAGDALLVQVSRRIRQALRPEDTVARLGGDEFVLLFEDLQGPEDAVSIADRLSQGFAEAFNLEDTELYVTCSMGLAMATTPEALPSELIRDAEVAMYRAKAKGEGIIEIFDPSMNRQALFRLQLEAELRRAIERREFVLHYQPLVGLQSGRIEGWEALVRWRHPERGMVPPMQFIPLAEETGLIVPIGRWVLEEACRQAADWTERYPSPVPRLMNVNISGRQFQARDLVESVRRALDESGFPAPQLKLEITESVMMRDPQASLEAMQVLSGQAIHLVVDDFGTGYSSLSYLRRFPVDTLKIDKSFVDGLGSDAEATAIVQAIIGLARSLSMRVVAEGIETEAQLAQLRTLDCDQGQGYFFSRPLDADAAEALLARQPEW